jgi:hypothetical protein
MVKLEPGNCPLKPSQRRQLASWLKRAVHLGERIGDFILRITVRRVGRCWQMRASAHDRAGDFVCRTRGSTWREACRDLCRAIANQLHSHRLAMVRV